MRKLNTIELLALATVTSLVLWIGSFFFVRIPDSMHNALAGVFFGYNSALLIALRSDGGPGQQPPSPPAVPTGTQTSTYNTETGLIPPQK